MMIREDIWDVVGPVPSNSGDYTQRSCIMT